MSACDNYTVITTLFLLQCKLPYTVNILTLGFSGCRVFPKQLVCSSFCSAVWCKQGLPKKKCPPVPRLIHYSEIPYYHYKTIKIFQQSSTLLSLKHTLCLRLNWPRSTQTGSKAGWLQGLVVSHKFFHSLTKPWCLWLRFFQQITCRLKIHLVSV